MSGRSEPRRGVDLPASMERLRTQVPRPAQVWVRDAVRAYGILTAARRPLPDYLIIGTKKGGTTSLFNWLLRHPHVARMFPPMQKLKSAHYFDINYGRGERWYRSHFPTDGGRLRRVDGKVVRILAGEASPYYMFHPAAASRAYETVPAAKIIVLLRDPVARAYSNYNDRRATGTEPLPIFEEALHAEAHRLATIDMERLQADPNYYSFEHDNHSYLARGRYAEQLSRWFALFPRPQILVLKAESMFTDPVKTFVEVQEFLGLPTMSELPLRRYNERPEKAVSSQTVAWLADYYRPHNAALYAQLGEDLGWEAHYPPAGQSSGTLG